MTGDIVVQLAGGTYRLSAPLVFNAADSGTNGHTVIWQAAAGAAPVLSGGQQITGWTLHDSAANIWAAAVPTGADSRQLYVDGALAPRAAIPIARSSVQITANGMNIVDSSLNYLASLPEQNRIEVESQNSFTDRFAPVSSISGTTVTMQQPAWNNNNWGYDTLASPFAGGQLYLENSYSFLKNAGQWYLDPQAGQLYYKAASGQSPSSHDVELPRLTSLVQMSGSYSNPVANITFQGVAFEHSTWLQPGSSLGYADQQTGTFLAKTYTQPANILSSCQSGCQLFEATPTAGTRSRPPSRSRPPPASRSAATPSPTSARSAWASATTRTPWPPASGWAPRTSRSTTARSATTPAPASSSAVSSPTRTTRRTPR